MSNSVISLGLGLGGGKAATSSGRSAGGGGVFANVRAVNFDGTDDYMKCDDNFLSLFRSSFSVSFWVKFNGTPSGTQILLSSSNGLSTDRIQIFHTGSTILSFYEANDVGTVPRNSGSQTWTNWNHVAATYEQSGSSCADVLYVNGSSVASGSKTLDMSAYGTGTAPNFLNWAARALGTAVGLHANVKLDEMAFFGSALSASDVSTIYNSGVPADLSSFSPAHWWRMGEINGGSGTTIADQGSGSVDGELINGPTYTTDIPS